MLKFNYNSSTIVENLICVIFNSLLAQYFYIDKDGL